MLVFMENFQDESSLVWISSSGEKSLKLASVSRIIPGQRTVRSFSSLSNSTLNLRCIHLLVITLNVLQVRSTFLSLTCAFNFQAVFRRYLRPEKDYLSFSLIYNYGKRSLDLVSYIDQVPLPCDFVI